MRLLRALPVSVTTDPGGKFAYVADRDSNDVRAYSINPGNGTLTFVGIIAAGTAPRSVTVDPSGRFAYVTNPNIANVSVYSINPASCLLISACGGGGADPTPANGFVVPLGIGVVPVNDPVATT